MTQVRYISDLYDPNTRIFEISSDLMRVLNQNFIGLGKINVFFFNFHQNVAKVGRLLKFFNKFSVLDSKRYLVVVALIFLHTAVILCAVDT